MQFDQVYQYLYTKKMEVTLFLIGMILIGLGVFALRIGVVPSKIELIKPSNQEIGNQIYVDIAGAVNSPGVVKLILGARTGEAIASAGGFSARADLDWVSKNLNQAKTLNDGEKIYIPSTELQPPSSNNQIISNTQEITLKTNINLASESELDKLPGIGPVTAGKIIKGRPYAKIEELSERKIVSEKVWQQIKEVVTTW